MTDGGGGFLGFGFSVDVNTPKLIHWSCRVSLVPVGQQHCCSLAGCAAEHNFF